MSVRRTDGAAVQAQIICRSDDGAATRSDVFAEPVPALSMRRATRPDGTHLWVLKSDLRPRRCSDLFQLIDTILAFSTAKQRRIASPPGLPASA
jgi:hypothetical protein